jgi:methylated-DNA-[protein]-cysteine S-methyltransferase
MMKAASLAVEAQEAPSRVLRGITGKKEEELAYSTAESPFGPLLVVVSPKGLVRVGFPEDDVDDQLERLAADITPRIVEDPRRLQDVTSQLDRYFEGKLTAFEIPIDWASVAGFRRRVLVATARIPYGSVATYTQMAQKAGSPKASRAAGSALGSNPVPIVVPCHRVLRTGGNLGGYGGGLDRKRFLLQLEGAIL